MSLTASDTDCVSTFTSVYTAWHHSTCLTSARRSQKFRVDNIFALLTVDSYIPQGSMTTFGRRSFACAAPIHMELPTRFSQRHCFILICFSDTVQNLSSYLLLNTSTSSAL